MQLGSFAIVIIIIPTNDLYWNRFLRHVSYSNENRQNSCFMRNLLGNDNVCYSTWYGHCNLVLRILFLVTFKTDFFLFFKDKFLCQSYVSNNFPSFSHDLLFINMQLEILFARSISKQPGRKEKLRWKTVSPRWWILEHKLQKKVSYFIDNPVSM